MKSLALVFQDEDEARVRAGALAANWKVVLAGPDDFLEVDRDGQFTSQVAGGWVVLASKSEIETIKS